MRDETITAPIAAADVHREVLDAKERIENFIVETPLEHSAVLSDRFEASVYLKCEHLQHTGSFKLRGAMSKLTHIRESTNQNDLEVITASTGNHGLAVAYAANKLKFGATIYLPEDTDEAKQKAIKRLGSKIVPVAGDGLQAELEARKASEARGIPYVSPYNDLHVIAGQGTIGYELHEFPKFDAVFLAAGGGGLISGVGSYMKAANSVTKIIGCWPENADSLKQCLEAGKFVDVTELPTLSTSTAGPVEPGSITLNVCRQVVDEYVSVSEADIADAMRLVAENEHYLVEGAAGVAVAGFIKLGSQMKGKKVAIILCGRNLSKQQLKEVFSAT